MNPSGSLTDKGLPIISNLLRVAANGRTDWNPTTYEEALNGSAFTAYLGAKSLAEKAVWELADTHPDLDITTFCPPLFFGPFAPEFSIPTPDYLAVSTTIYLYRLLKPTGTYPPFAGMVFFFYHRRRSLLLTVSISHPGYIDVRDLARAHVAALDAPPESKLGRKRLLMASPYDLNYKTAVEFIAEKRPELKDRLIDSTKAPKFPLDRMPLDLKRVAQVTGVEENSYFSWQDTLLATIDNLITLEKDWESKGFQVDIPIPDTV